MSTIWIVEDDAKIALLIDMTVRKLGHDTLCLSDAEALERQRRKGTGLPDLLLLDLMLRATSGFDVLRQAAASVGKPEPELRELYDPERVYLTLHLETNGLALGTRDRNDASQGLASGGQAIDKRWRAMASDRQALVVAMAHDRREIRASDVAALLGVSRQRSRAIVKEMTDAGILCKHGNGRYTYYTLVPGSPDY